MSASMIAGAAGSNNQIKARSCVSVNSISYRQGIQPLYCKVPVSKAP